jgi:hypothetical protein
MNRLFFGALICAAVIAASLPGCTQQEETPPPPDYTSVPPAPAPVPLPPAESTAPAPQRPSTPAPGLEVSYKIESKDNFVSLYAEQQDYKAGEEQSDAKDREFADRWAAITKDMTPRKLTEELEFLAVKTIATAANQYTYSFLLRPVENLSEDYHLLVQGHVFPANLQYLPEEFKATKYRTWAGIIRDVPTSEWKPGEFYVVNAKVADNLTPYNLQIVLHKRDNQNQWEANVGDLLPVGWQWDVFDEQAFVDRVNTCTTFAELYAQAPPGPEVSETVAKALAAKWSALTSGMSPTTMIDGLDFVAVNTNVTGEEEYTFSFLFRTTKDLDTDYHLNIVATVDPSFVQHIKPDKPDGLYTTWHGFLYNNPTSQWKPGECHVAQLKVETAIIPYHLTLMLQTRNEKREWTANPGERIDLGWQADTAR